MHRMAQVLIERETIDASEVAEILQDVPKWQHARNGTVRIEMPAEDTTS
jgi:hypothetical protein